LRLYSIVHGTDRVATKDTVLLKRGEPDEQCPVLVTKGTFVAFNLATLHLHLWGHDAEDFRPERCKMKRPHGLVLYVLVSIQSSGD
ncbi:MAG: hypothetical protein Q9183_003315, partial [Haloplaca sp. 2 TL-2023]